MCIAIPMQIVDVDQISGKTQADYRGNMLEIDTRLVDVKPGDFVLVHAGCAIEIVGEQQAEETDELLRELEEMVNNGY